MLSHVTRAPADRDCCKMTADISIEDLVKAKCFRQLNGGLGAATKSGSQSSVKASPSCGQAVCKSSGALDSPVWTGARDVWNPTAELRALEEFTDKELTHHDSDNNVTCSCFRGGVVVWTCVTRRWLSNCPVLPPPPGGAAPLPLHAPALR